MKNKIKILVVEDDLAVFNPLDEILNFNDYQVIHSATGSDALLMTASHCPDLVLLNMGLPDMLGIRVLEKIRDWSDIPIIILSSKRDEKSIVRALDVGANDYITKPFGKEELLARIRVAIRLSVKSSDNSKSKNGKRASQKSFAVESLFIDYLKRIVTINNNPVHMTPIEYKILVLLAENTGKVLTHDYIINHVWGPFASDSQILRINIANIRRKFKKQQPSIEYIETEMGVGYRMIEG